MNGPRTARLVGTVLRCSPLRWRQRHGDEAAELASLLIGDGTPAGSIAWSYLAGAAREWLTPRSGRGSRAGARTGGDPCPGPPADDRPGRRAWPVLLTPALLPQTLPTLAPLTPP